MWLQLRFGLWTHQKIMCVIKISILHGSILILKMQMETRQSFMSCWSYCWVPCQIPGLRCFVPQKSSYFRLSLQSFSWGDILFMPYLAQRIFLFSQVSTDVMCWQYTVASGMSRVLVLTFKRSFKVMFHFGRKNPQNSEFPVGWLPSS